MLAGFTKLVYVHRILTLLTRPFRNFLQLEDLEEFKASTATKRLTPRWKSISLVTGLILQIVGSFAAFVVSFTALARDNVFTTPLALVTISWVSLNRT